MGEFLEIAKVMVQPTMKLLDMCGSAIGTVYEPRHIRKLADAEAYKIKQLGSTITESDNLPIAYENGNISMSTVNFEDFAKRAEFRAKYQLLQEQNNIEHVVRDAYNALEGLPEIPNDPIDEDWSTRFFNIAKEIKTEDMQKIWGQILAGEIVRPGSFSMRTLETIRNISRTEAQTFQKIVPLIIRSDREYLISSDDEINKDFDVTYEDIILLDECGLILSTGALSYNMHIPHAHKSYVYTDSLVAIFEGISEKEEKISIGVFVLTKAGRELYNILAHNANDTYFHRVIGKVYNKHKTKVNVTTHSFLGMDNEKVTFDPHPVQVFKTATGTVSN